MLSPLICGSFQDQEEDDFEFLKSCPLAQKPSKKPTRWHNFGGRNKKEQHNKNKNPYAERGLDKFSALLAEFDSKRQKIYTQKGSENISLLGFVYSNTDDYKPIVVRLKKKQQQPDKNKLIKKIHEKVDKPKTEAIENNNNNNTNIDKEPKQYAQVQSNVESDRKSSQTNIRLLWSKIKLEKLSRPGYYVPVIMILILVFLVFFGRSFAILCTTLAWYFIPNIQEHKSNGSNLKNMKTLMKTNYVKAFSYNSKMVSSGGGDEHRYLRKTMQNDYVKSLSYNNYSNNKMMVSSNDDRLSSPTSVLTRIKSAPQRWP